MKLVVPFLVVLPLYAETVKLTVTVIDAVTLAPISGAQVRTSQLPLQATGAGGAFTVDVLAGVRLWVPEITAPGYSPQDSNTFIEIAAEPVTVTYRLSRICSLSGRIVDPDSGGPIAGVNVEPLLVSWVRGRRELQRVFKSAATRKDGTFSIKDLRAGDYALNVNSFSADGKRRPVTGYPQLVWPGGGDLQSAAPFNVAYGADLQIGDVNMRKSEISKLSFSVTGGQCAEGQAYNATLSQFSFSSSFTRGFTSIPCGGVAGFEDLTPGDYELQVDAPWQKPDEREWGVVPVQIVKGEQKVTVPVTPPITFHGTLAVDRDAALPAKLEVHFWARGSRLVGAFSHIPSFGAKLADKGSVEGRSYIPAGGEIEVNISPLPANYFVRETRYDGAASPGNSFVIHGGAAQHELTIILSDRAATLSGSVRTADGKVIPAAKVLLTRWPADIVTDYPFGVEEASADGSGGYSFTHLGPGAYRAIAVPAAVRAKLEEPGVMLALFASAESFELGEASSVVRQLAPVAPR